MGDTAGWDGRWEPGRYPKDLVVVLQRYPLGGTMVSAHDDHAIGRAEDTSWSWLSPCWDGRVTKSIHLPAGERSGRTFMDRGGRPKWTVAANTSLVPTSLLDASTTAGFLKAFGLGNNGARRQRTTVRAPLTCRYPLSEQTRWTTYSGVHRGFEQSIKSPTTRRVEEAFSEPWALQRHTSARRDHGLSNTIVVSGAGHEFLGHEW